MKIHAQMQYRLSLIIFLFSLLACTRHQPLALKMHHDAGEDIDGRERREILMLRDPATGKIPDHIRDKELAFAATLPKYDEPKYKSGSLWQSRGPWNVGGRTRAVAIDVTNENIILAGAVCGGLWRSTDGGASWTKITGPAQDYSISCIVQDTRKGKTNTWYAGTGELLGNNGGIHGDGILKSTDGGLSFTKLSTTAHNTPQGSQPFNMISSIVVAPTDSADIVYAATGGYNGYVYRSVNGGQNWNVLKSSLTCYYNEVAMSKKGILYYTQGNPFGPGSGIYRTTDGIKSVNILPSKFTSNFQRMVIGIDPNDENTVYFLGYSPGFGRNNTSFWKYHYLSGTGAGSGGTWKDLSANIPEWGGYVGNFEIQTGYNLVVKVKPGDPKTVFLGSTNLIRSTDSFSSSDHVSWIGGYPINYSLAQFSIAYPNHHPDQHNLVFYPSDPNKMLSTNDGGIFRTNNNMADTVRYTSLNTGYITTQFYALAIDHGTPGNDELIGGMQDQGTYTNKSVNPGAAWNLSFTGDGSYCAIADGANEYYLSCQMGWTYRVKLDANGYPYQCRKMDPPGAFVPLVFAPYVLDPNNQKRMFFLSATGVFRNNDVTQLPLRSVNINYDTISDKTGWESITTDTLSWNTAIAISHQPAERLVYGTYDGHVYRLDSAVGPNPTKKNISSPLFKAGSFVNCIEMNPLNADEMIVVFSNYNVRSLFYTRDGGTSWTDISGNLEQFPDGTGNGPSCRWASIMPSGHHFVYFIGTSTGLYATDSLKGINTRWTQQSPDGIGNDIVTMIDNRPADGFVALSTYGNGVYSAHINFPYQVTGIDETETDAYTDNKIDCYPNPVRSGGMLTIRFPGTPVAAPLSLSLMNELGQATAQLGHFPAPAESTETIQVRLPFLKPGIYYLKAENGETVKVKTLIVR
jgi:photosystem II stability/assembly factor-like uncharacterized protein